VEIQAKKQVILLETHTSRKLAVAAELVKELVEL